MNRVVTVGESVSVALGPNGWLLTDDDGVSEPLGSLMLSIGAPQPVGLRGPEQLTVTGGSVTVNGLVDGLQIVSSGVDATVWGPIRFIVR